MVNTKLLLKRTIIIVLCVITVFFSGCGYPAPYRRCPGGECDDETIDTAAIKNPTEDMTDYFRGVIILTKPDSDTLFYDKVFGENETFADLLDRQFSLLAEHILYGLESFYGLLKMEKSYPSNYFPLTFNKYTLISSGARGREARNCEHINRDLISLTCGECISWMAGERDDLQHINPFDFSKAIDGGFQYDAEHGGFGSTLMPNWEWAGIDYLTIDDIKMQLAKIVATGMYDVPLTTIPYQEYDIYLEAIDHLGFTVTQRDILGDVIVTGEVDVIKEFILKSIIGELQVESDKWIMEELFDGDLVQLRSDGGDPFEDNLNKHYYKAYIPFVNALVDKAVTISVEGRYPNIYGQYIADDFAAYPIFPRVNAIYKEIYDLDKLDENNPKTFTKLLKTEEKILDIIFIPDMADSAIDIRYTQLRYNPKYGIDFANNWEDRDAFYLTSDWFFSFIASNENELDEFILKLKFNVVAQGEEILNSYLPVLPYFDKENILTYSDFYTEKGDLIVMSPDKLTEYGIVHDLVENGKISQNEVEKFMGMYHVSPLFSPMGLRRLKNYDGVELYKSGFFGALNNDIFRNDGTLVIGCKLFQLYQEINKEDPTVFIPGIIPKFRSGNNCFQISLEYYNLDEERIPAQDINIAFMTGLDGFLESMWYV